MVSNLRPNTRSCGKWGDDVGIYQLLWRRTIDKSRLQEKGEDGKNLGCHIISLSIEEYNILTSLLTDSKEEQIFLMQIQLQWEARSQEKYISNNMIWLAQPSYHQILLQICCLLLQHLIRLSTIVNPKNVRFNKSLWKHAAEGITALHKFDILAAGKYSSMHHNAWIVPFKRNKRRPQGSFSRIWVVLDSSSTTYRNRVSTLPLPLSLIFIKYNLYSRGYVG